VISTWTVASGTGCPFESSTVRVIVSTLPRVAGSLAICIRTVSAPPVAEVPTVVCVEVEPNQEGSESVPPERIGKATSDAAIIVSAESPIADIISDLRERCGRRLSEPNRPRFAAGWGRRESGGFGRAAFSTVDGAVNRVTGPSSTATFLPQISQNLAPSSNFLPQISQNKVNRTG